MPSTMASASNQSLYSQLLGHWGRLPRNTVMALLFQRQNNSQRSGPGAEGRQQAMLQSWASNWNVPQCATFFLSPPPPLPSFPDSLLSLIQDTSGCDESEWWHKEEEEPQEPHLLLWGYCDGASDLPLPSSVLPRTTGQICANLGSNCTALA